MKTIDLRDLKAGDKAWSSQIGEVQIKQVIKVHDYPIKAINESGAFGSFKNDGLCNEVDAHPTLFHSEQEFREYWGLQRDIDAPLTKREQFAMAAMQGLLNSAAYSKPEHYALASVEQADVLLTKLNEKQ
jgi:hypothetical protein